MFTQIKKLFNKKEKIVINNDFWIWELALVDENLNEIKCKGYERKRLNTNELIMVSMEDGSGCYFYIKDIPFTGFEGVVSGCGLLLNNQYLIKGKFSNGNFNVVKDHILNVSHTTELLRKIKQNYV